MAAAKINSLTIGSISGGTFIFGNVGQVCPATSASANSNSQTSSGSNASPNSNSATGSQNTSTPTSSNSTPTTTPRFGSGNTNPL
ncbi:hypothetical protein Q4S57_14840 [Priestia megaterium]|uniref:hypothetical protein n=1 Tax=Priestia megaterium TaxID=1404 RepID=UPI0026E4318F|nr:hypothetical protein [Priestia megaterium]MDO6849235.1 hypothetical protein [Priestia megaterium]